MCRHLVFVLDRGILESKILVAGSGSTGYCKAQEMAERFGVFGSMVKLWVYMGWGILEPTTLGKVYVCLDVAGPGSMHLTVSIAEFLSGSRTFRVGIQPTCSCTGTEPITCFFFQSYLSVISEWKERPTDPHYMTMKAIANVIYSIVNGKRSDYADAHFNRYVEDLNWSFEALGDSGIAMALPFIKWVKKQCAQGSRERNGRTFWCVWFYGEAKRENEWEQPICLSEVQPVINTATKRHFGWNQKILRARIVDHLGQRDVSAFGTRERQSKQAPMRRGFAKILELPALLLHSVAMRPTCSTHAAAQKQKHVLDITNSTPDLSQ